MRAIAEKANMTNANIYFYFSSKKELYSAIVSPAYYNITSLIDSGAELVINSKKLNPDVLMENYYKAAEFFKSHKAAISVLFVHNEGTSYHHVREDFLNRFTDRTYTIAEAIARESQKILIKDKFYFRILAVFWLEGFLEIVRHFRDVECAAHMLKDYVDVIFSGIEKAIG
jgi:AcrR family transcriptional regulator